MLKNYLYFIHLSLVIENWEQLNVDFYFYTRTQTVASSYLHNVFLLQIRSIVQYVILGERVDLAFCTSTHKELNQMQEEQQWLVLQIILLKDKQM